MAHLAVGWGIAHSMLHVPAKPKPTPVEVRLIAPPPPPPRQATTPPKVEVKLPLLAPLPLVPPPLVAVVAPQAMPLEAAPSPSATTRTETPAVTAAAAPAAPAPSPSIRELAPGSVRYAVEPHLHMPRMSRRLGESGTVLLRIAVDANGQLKSAVVKKSSGFERLDQQALIDIRSARFEPYLDKGQAVEWTADAGLQYELR